MLNGLRLHTNVESSGDQGAFAMTSTVNTYFGSLVVSNSTGIIFNNQMDDFSTPGMITIPACLVIINFSIVFVTSIF